MTTTNTIFAWHFTGDTLRNGDPLPRCGRWLKYDGQLVMCESGLHASRHPMDALYYAPGPLLHRVKCGGTIIERDDKLVCSQRMILGTRNAEAMLRRFAKDRALTVIHLWNAPQLVREYLEWDDETNRDAARAAARAAAWASAWAAARAAASASAMAAAWAAAWAAARAAAWSAARDEFERRVNALFETEPNTT